LAATAGIIRWATAAMTAWFPAMALVEPLHGLTFALLHLACMDVITRVAPATLAATAQAIYGTFAMGATAAAVTLASGPLYAKYGAGAFWAMAGLCALALPVASGLRATGLPQTPPLTGRSARSLPTQERSMEPMKPMEPMDFGPKWWPDELGEPSTSGGQNDVKYAFFAEKHRLAIQQDGRVTLYDSADHEISGVSQLQGETGSLAFVSQHGTVSLDRLERVEC